MTQTSNGSRGAVASRVGRSRKKAPAEPPSEPVEVISDVPATKEAIPTAVLEAIARCAAGKCIGASAMKAVVRSVNYSMITMTSEQLSTICTHQWDCATCREGWERADAELDSEIHPRRKPARV